MRTINETEGDGRRDDAVNILIVDDRHENLFALSSVLDELGEHVVEATTGGEALRAAQEMGFAVILLDVNLPDVNGFEIAASLRSRPLTRNTPIIFLTAIDKDDKQVSRGYALGAVDFIFKPADPAILRSKVAVFTDLHRKKRQIEDLNRSLEGRVRDRTRALQEANEELARHVRERLRAEGEVRALNAALEERVRARTAELEAANEELRSFSYSVSHDLRAPLRKINAFVRLLVEEAGTSLDEMTGHYVDGIRRNAAHMDAIIVDMLKLSRISSEEMSMTEVDLSALAQDVVAELQRDEPERSVSVYVEPGLHAHGDASLLRMALDNLLNNAWKFTGKTAEARIEFASASHGDQRGFRIWDNGAGFPMDEAGRLFRPFQRLHTAKAFPGTGIGLAIVQRVLRRHGGDIWAEGEVGKGAAFTFVLPS